MKNETFEMPKVTTFTREELIVEVAFTQILLNSKNFSMLKSPE